MYEWTASPESPDLNNQIFFFKWLRLGVSGSINLLDGLL